MPTVGVNLDTTQYVLVSSGRNPLILQAHRDSVRVAISAVKPAVGNAVFHQLNGGDEPLPIPSPDTSVWALGVSGTSSLIVSALSIVPVTVDDKVAISTIDLTHENDAVTILNEISRKLSILIQYEALLHKVDLSDLMEDF